MQTPDQYLLDLPELQERDRPTFENFVPGQNELVLAALCEMAADSGPRLLYIYGAVGVGLTHLITAYLTSDGSSASRWSYRTDVAVPQGVPVFNENCRRYAVDDIDALQGEDIDALRRLLDKVKASGNARLVCAGHVPPNALPLPAAVKSRLVGGLCLRVVALSESERFQELKRLAALRGILMTEDMEVWMSTRLPRDMRTLTRVLDIANQLSLHAKSRVTLSTVKEAAHIAHDAGLLKMRLPSESIDSEASYANDSTESAHQA